MTKPKCSECGTAEPPVFRCEDGKDRCVMHASRYAPDKRDIIKKED